MIILITNPFLALNFESKIVERTCLNKINTLGYNILWSYNDTNIITTSPAFMDRDQDGNLELIVGDSDGYVYCINSSGVELWKFKTNGQITASPAISDVNKDKHPEIIVASEDNNVYCLNDYGSEMWHFTSGNKIVQPPMIVDIDKDENNEIIVASSDNNLYCLRGNGSQKWSYYRTNSGNSPAIGDVDHCNNLEILTLIGARLYKLTNEGVEVSSADLFEVLYSDREPLLADINNNGNFSIFYFMENNIWEVNPIDYKKSLFCPVEMESPSYDFQPSPVIAADLTNDGFLEILFTAKYNTTYGYIYCYDYLGNQLWNFTTTTDGTTYSLPPIFADLDNDLDMEILIGGIGGKFYCLDHLGNILWDYDRQISNSPLVVDLNSDGLLEIILPLNENDQKIVCLELTGITESGGAQWARRRGNNYNIGQLDQDCDYLDTLTEFTIGINPYNPDYDSDSLTDGVEILIYFTNPKDNDTDDDQLSDGDEIAYKTNPFVQDSDIDGIKDGDEVHIYLTDPLDSDSDDDGIWDGEEVFNYQTDPNDADSDGDGYSDGEEVDSGTNPLDPEDYPGATTEPTPTNTTTTKQGSLFGKLTIIIFLPMVPISLICIYKKRKIKNF